MSLNGQWPEELFAACGDSHQFGVLWYMKPLSMATRNYQRLPPQNLHLQHGLRGCLFNGCHDYTLFQGSSLREATNLEQSHSRVVAQENGLSSKHGDEGRVKQSCHSFDTGNLSCHFLRKGWICCVLSVAVAICSKPVCHHDFKLYEPVRASKN